MTLSYAEAEAEAGEMVLNIALLLPRSAGIHGAGG